MSTFPSIMVATYPKQVENWTNAGAEAAMEVIKDTIHGARSLRADYKIANHVKADFYFRISSTNFNEQTLAALNSQSEDFCTLAKGNFLRYLSESDEASKHCCVKVLNNCLSLLVNLEGIVDVEQEIQRLKKESDRIRPMIDQYQRKVQQAGNDSKMPEAVKQSNVEKLASYEAELQALLTALTLFEGMK
jgi:valyl-tRNA synthetase